jgi:hypothetical protein
VARAIGEAASAQGDCRRERPSELIWNRGSTLPLQPSGAGVLVSARAPRLDRPHAEPRGRVALGPDMQLSRPGHAPGVVRLEADEDSGHRLAGYNREPYHAMTGDGPSVTELQIPITN